LGGVFQRLLRNKADDFAGKRLHSVSRGFPLHELEHARNGRLLEVGQVHGDLRQPANRHSHTFHIAEAAIREANGLANFLGDFYVSSIQEDVVRDQEFAGSDHGCSSGWMYTSFAEIRPPCVIDADVIAQALKLPRSNILQVLPFGRGCSSLVEVHRDLVALPELLAHLAGNGRTILERDAFDGDERNNIGRPNAWMCSSVLGEINELSRLPDSAYGGFGYRGAGADQGNSARI